MKSKFLEDEIRVMVEETEANRSRFLLGAKIIDLLACKTRLFFNGKQASDYVLNYST